MLHATYLVPVLMNAMLHRHHGQVHRKFAAVSGRIYYRPAQRGTGETMYERA